MVCLCAAGGRLICGDVQDVLEQASLALANGNMGRAAELYNAALQASPNNPNAMLMLGIIAHRCGNYELAYNLADATLAIVPDLRQAMINRCLALLDGGKTDQALQDALNISEKIPDFAEGWNLLGQIYKNIGTYQKAIECYNKALSLHPDNARYQNNCALAHLADGDFISAYKQARLTQAHDPSFPPMLLGNVFNALGYPAQAAKCFARVKELMPSLKDAASSEAMARLCIGDLENGWKIWETRPDMAPELKNIPLWQGEKVSHLLLYEDQGIGDAIQFARYMGLLSERAEKISLKISSTLEKLFAENFPNITVYSNTSEASAPIDARCRMSSMPYIFSTRLDNIPTPPYLISPNSSEKYATLKGTASPLIGIVWAGNAKFHSDQYRSIPVELLYPVINSAKGHLVSLQKDRMGCPKELPDASLLLNDFADTAEIISSLDLIITVDTAIAHLAGAMGKPVWILLPFNNDWRWMLGREDSPWYPSARLFRQEKLGDWSSVIDKVAVELKKFIAGDLSVLNAQKWQAPPLTEHPFVVPLPPIEL